MGINNLFVKDETELSNSVRSFFYSPEYWRDIISKRPKYFVHLIEDGLDMFGLSKYCAYNEVSPIDYIQRYRYKTNGGTTQKHISKILGRSWVSLARNPSKLQNAFEKWFYSLFPSKNDLDEIYILSLGEIRSLKPITKSKNSFQSPETLQETLKIKNEIGKIGEEIAYQYELKRLKNLGIKNPEYHVAKTYERNINAGFDIWSNPSRNETRYIEVKSTTKDEIEFFITSNEIEVLKKHNECAYIYFVLIEELKTGTGRVRLELQNPIEHFENTKSLRPILYSDRLIDKIE